MLARFLLTCRAEGFDPLGKWLPGAKETLFCFVAGVLCCAAGKLSPGTWKAESCTIKTRMVLSLVFAASYLL
jgi:hypothetical protein